ncbi:GIY-YIG nuclease family protein [Rugamonas sp.]|uniref:GIY-YIG nuclease family protein n=1 Tax=Rugamonas sp. TaxID=1926287 RepID=UPI0025DB41AC|nr:GIY-YIG nuclease family protein [Rugamonas sp.]
MNRHRQAELKTGYKLNPPDAGVIAITHRASGKALIDSSRNPQGLLNRHRAELKLGGHRNAALMADWKRDGEAAFDFAVVASLPPPSDPAVDADAELAKLLAARLKGCPRGAANSYL